jgi:uncharacterized protein (DUF427 family)
MVRAHWNSAVIAESDDTVVIDGNHYFPAGSVNEEYLVASDTTTVYPWKGRASCYLVEVEGKLNRDAAWYYAGTDDANHVRGVPGRRRLEQLVRSAGLLAQATTGRGAA